MKLSSIDYKEIIVKRNPSCQAFLDHFKEKMCVVATRVPKGLDSEVLQFNKKVGQCGELFGSRWFNCYLNEGF